MKNSLKTTVLTAISIGFMIWPIYVLYRWTTAVAAASDAQPTISNLIEVPTSRYPVRSEPVKLWNEPIVSITIDDGLESDYFTAFPILSEFGFDATHFINSNHLGKPSYLTLEYINQMHSNGHDFSSHTLSHLDLTDLNRDNRLIQLLGSQQWLMDGGFEANDFASPSGVSDEQSQKEIAIYYRSHRSEDSGINTAENLNSNNLLSYTVDIKTTVQDVESWIDQAIEKNGWLILTFHQIDNSGREESVLPETFKDILQSLRDRGVEVAKLGQVLDAISTE